MQKAPSKVDFAGYLAMAQKGDVAAQIYVGWSYLEGKIVPQDTKAGEGWLRKAYEQGSLEAGYRLAMVLVHHGDAEGIKLLIRVGDQGYPPANYELGDCLYTGNLVDRDAKAAGKRWSDAEKKGHLIAQIKLLKYQNSTAPFYMKPVFAVRIILSLIRSSVVFFRNDQDQRVLGTFS